MREPPCAALGRERRQLESEESNAHADIVELKTIVAHLERLRLELTREQAFELRTCEKIRSSERTLARQTQKVLNHLQITYPIKNLYGDSTCTVLSLELPIDLSTLDDEHVSSALGYICHIVPLRYELVYNGSRSLVRDGVASRDGGFTFPLFRRETERRRFDRAVGLLGADIDQLHYARGLSLNRHLSLLGKLRVLLDHEHGGRLDYLIPTAEIR